MQLRVYNVWPLSNNMGYKYPVGEISIVISSIDYSYEGLSVWLCN